MSLVSLNVSSCLSPAIMCSAGSELFLGTDPTLDLHQGPMATLGGLEAGFQGPPMALTISGLGPGGGGSSRGNPLAEIFRGGKPPTEASVIQDVVESHSLLDALKNGTVYVWVQPASGSTMPRLNTLAAIPTDYQTLYQAMIRHDDWVTWMPRFQESRGTPTGTPGVLTHEAKTRGGGKTFHYRARFESREIADGALCFWTLDQGGFRLARKCTGLRKNDGSWSFVSVPGEPNETLMAYQIHIEPVANSFLLKVLKPIIMNLTLGEFHHVVGAMANRATDPNWRQGSPANPSGRAYRVQRV